jgi:hypothetical protein
VKPVDQTIFGYPEGNCFAACIASILEMPLALMPEHKALDNEQWWEVWYRFLQPRNAHLVNFKNGGEWWPLGFSIAAVRSPRGNWLHACVALDGKIIHDPHPERTALELPIEEFTMFYALDPSRPIQTTS